MLNINIQNIITFIAVSLDDANIDEFISMYLDSEDIFV